jgi:S-DNA-T family DNA segregation ATPase FtsK/SpoIIIE
LTRILGVGGTAIALLAWLLIALILSLDVTLDELFHRISAAASSARKKIPAGSGRSQLPGTGSNSIADGQARAAGQTTQASTFLGDEPFLPIPPLPDSATAASSVSGHYLQAAWVLPVISQILEPGVELDRNDEADLQRAHVIEETLAAFGAPVKVIEINRGPTITQFGVEPDFIETRSGRTRVRVSKITSLANDLALALSARTIRVEAPVPGKGFVGIEVPNDEIALVALRDVIESEAFKRLKSPLRFALGQNVSGSAVAADLAAMPHLLVAGQTGSGKSVMVNSLICCMLANNTPDDLRLIMVDPKRVELSGYNGIPHLLAPVIVELERVISALQWVAREMDMRYRKLAEAGSRNILDYNARMAAIGQRRLPYLVVIIDELADLMMLAPDETERTITRLAQLSRATGIHLVLATQRPSVDVVTGLIKANFPARVAFAVASGVDSRVILDQPGAETLLGRGDLLFQAPDAPAPVRLQGVFVSESEIQRLVNYWQSFSGLVEPAPTAIGGVVDDQQGGLPLKQMSFWETGNGSNNEDPLLFEAIDLARRQGRASVSMLQRRLRIGYTRAARLIETMEERGIVGPPEGGTGVREILDYGPAAPPIDDA